MTCEPIDIHALKELIRAAKQRSKGYVDCFDTQFHGPEFIDALVDELKYRGYQITKK